MPDYQTRMKRRRQEEEPTRLQSEHVPNPLPAHQVFDAIPVEDGRFFEEVVEPLLPEYLRDRNSSLETELTLDGQGNSIRLLTRSERSSYIAAAASDPLTPRTLAENIAARKLKVQVERRRNNVVVDGIRFLASSEPVTMLPSQPAATAPSADVLDALYAIQSTRYENSFLSRLHGAPPPSTPGLIAVEWETRSPWMELMSDIREHHTLAHPEDEKIVETEAPIEYSTLQAGHLDQIHDLLHRAFWAGIDVSDSLHYSPERCTVIATYKKLVVGAAFFSSPQETYMTYLVVRAGWDNSRIATSMLYHLITMNPNKDVTLHVSANNPAMLLYNRFGFKAEEFIAGFYEAYLDPHSRASKNAFRLRLRR